MELYFKNKKNKIETYNQWEEHYIKSDPSHWSIGRSAESLAKYWCYENQEEITKMLKSNGLSYHDLNDGFIEYKTNFDSANGPRVHDLCFPNVSSKNGNYALSIEAKVDEPFDITNREYLERAEVNLKENPNSKSKDRLITIYESLTGNNFEDMNYTKHQFMNLRYQLFSGLMGTIAEANKNKLVKKAVFIIHTFETNKASLNKTEKNKKDLDRFIRLVCNKPEINSTEILKIRLSINNSTFSNLNIYYQTNNLEIYIGYLHSNTL